MASERLLKELNDQFNFELLSGYYYLAMAAYATSENFSGVSHFMVEQAKEEYEHAMKFYTFIDEMDGRVEAQAMTAPKNDFNSLLEVFQVALHHEKLVTARIEKLLDLAHEEKSYQTIQFLQWFVAEQVEEENHMKDIVIKLERIDNKYMGLQMLDKQLSAR